MIDTIVPEEFVSATVTGAGCDIGPEWVEAFRSVPRSLFVPRFFTQNADLSWELVERPSSRWTGQVWRNVPLITQLDGDDGLARRALAEPLRHGNATSSSSQPSLMALMLQALDVRPGHRVLEVGTGTGYNAALLCHRLGDQAVTTVDVDDGVTARARDRLAALGMRCRVVTGDGRDGCPDASPFDRIIATVGFARLPMSWLDQTPSGARVLFPLDLRGYGGLLPLVTVDEDGASGPFLPVFGGFMPVRSPVARRDAAVTALTEVADDVGATRSTDLDPYAADSEGPVGFFVGLRTGGLDRVGFVPSNGGPTESWFADGRGSWACHIDDPSGPLVRQDGPRRLWDEIEKACREWTILGEPSRERFELVVDRTGTHQIRLDGSKGPTWSLPARPSEG